jgi:superfamily II DNA or RNA helicase/very-short-patch-repair endonuclease
VLNPSPDPELLNYIVGQQRVHVGNHVYLVDDDVVGSDTRISVEFDGFEFHSERQALTYDRLCQNDLASTGRQVVRYSYDAIRSATRRCVEQLQAILSLDSRLRGFVIPNPVAEQPEMNPDPRYALAGRTAAVSGTETEVAMPQSYFESVREKLNLRTLRQCQKEAFGALANYYRAGGLSAACVMSVGAGKTALGIAACLGFATRRALVVTPGNVIRGTFDRAFDHQAAGNVLYGLPGGPLLPGAPPPTVRTLDRDEGAVRDITRSQLLQADIIITNFHSLGTGEDTDDILAKLSPEDVDYIVVDEAHIAAAESYQRLFTHFAAARTLLMSACFQRHDGRPIDADVVYRYRLIDSIADGNAKNLRVRRFAPDPEATLYEILWPDGAREEIVGRDALLEIIADDRKLAKITATSTEPIRRIMREVRVALDAQADVLYPIKPRVLFAALGERHAEQITRVAEEFNIPCAYLYYLMTQAQIRRTRRRYETESGDLQGIVQIKMLGQGYDFPPITVVVPMRPYGSFNEFYQFIGRGIRVVPHPSLSGREGPEQQYLDIIYHAELGLDDHIETIYRENDMDPAVLHDIPSAWQAVRSEMELPGSKEINSSAHPDAFVVFERGAVLARLVHDTDRVEARRVEPVIFTD